MAADLKPAPAGGSSAQAALPAALSWRQLTRAYPGGPTLDFGDFDLAAGATLVLRGDSGSGKSTLLALLAGLASPTSGRLSVGALCVSALPPAARDAWRGAALGFVPQRLHLSEALTVQGNLELPFFAAAVPADAGRIDALLGRLGLTLLRGRRPSTLSVGQAQRVAVARAVVRRPTLILADEPTASLDDAQAAATVALLRGAAAETGATLVLATHDARVVQALPEARTLRLPRAPASAPPPGAGLGA